MSGDEHHNPDPSAQEEALPTNPQDDVFGAMAQPPNVAEFLPPEQMQALEQVSVEYGDASDPAALSSEPVLHDMGMAPPQPGSLDGMTAPPPPVVPPPPVASPSPGPEGMPATPPAAPPLQGVTQSQGSEGMPGGGTHGTPVAPPPEPVEHDPGLQAPLSATPPRSAFKDSVQDNPTGVREWSSTPPPGSETIGHISANTPGEAVPLWTGVEPPATPPQEAPPPPDFESAAPPPPGSETAQPSLIYPPGPTQIGEYRPPPPPQHPDPPLLPQNPDPHDLVAKSPVPSVAADRAAEAAAKAAWEATEAASSAAAADVAAMADADATVDAQEAHLRADHAAAWADEAARQAAIASHSVDPQAATMASREAIKAAWEAEANADLAAQDAADAAAEAWDDFSW